MPCNAIVYLPATIRQLDATAMFANPETTKLTLEMFKATLAATLGQSAYSVENWGTNITARIPSGTIRIWNNGQVNIRLYAGTRNPEAITAAIEEAIKATLASLTQILTAQVIGATVQVTDTAFVGNNLVLSVNI
jgi:flavin-binding protein dodecin